MNVLVKCRKSNCRISKEQIGKAFELFIDGVSINKIEAITGIKAGYFSQLLTDHWLYYTGDNKVLLRFQSKV